MCDQNENKKDDFVDDIFIENFKQKVAMNDKFLGHRREFFEEYGWLSTDPDTELEYWQRELDEQHLKLLKQLDATRKIETEDARIKVVKIVNLLRSQSVDTTDFDDPNNLF